jgi:hypothetical protein
MKARFSPDGFSIHPEHRLDRIPPARRILGFQVFIPRLDTADVGEPRDEPLMPFDHGLTDLPDSMLRHCLEDILVEGVKGINFIFVGKRSGLIETRCIRPPNSDMLRFLFQAAP